MPIKLKSIDYAVALTTGFCFGRNALHCREFTFQPSVGTGGLWMNVTDFVAVGGYFTDLISEFSRGC